MLSSAHASYRSTVAKWTKGGHVYALNTMDAKLIWNATLVTDDLLTAQRQLIEKRKVDVDLKMPDGINFFVSLYTPAALKNFSLDDGSTWKIFLVGKDGQEVAASSVVPVSITPTEQVFYPYLNRWSKAYSIAFPDVDLGKRPKLVLRSIVAQSVLKWRISER